MRSFKETCGLSYPQSCVPRLLRALAVLLSLESGSALADTCVSPPRPFVPRDPKAASEYVHIIHDDFDLYFRDIQSYFRCLDEECARAFEEAREVSEEYGRFLDSLHR